MSLIYTIVVTLLALLILVGVHEFGHFWVARRCGVKVLRFSIGFGKPFFSRKDKHGTEFALAPIPLGGYVKMLDKRDTEVAPEDEPFEFTQKPVLHRIAILAAGPIANFLLAIIAYWVLFMAGESGFAPVVGKVEAGSPAEIAGLEAGQEIIAVDGADTPTWQAVMFQLMQRIGDTGELHFTVKYPDSDMQYSSNVAVNRWLSEDDQPDMLRGLGLMPRVSMVVPKLDEVAPDSPAQNAGLQTGDVLLSADGQALADWMEWVEYVRARPGSPIVLVFDRNGQILDTTIVPERIEDDGGDYGRVGVTPLVPEVSSEAIRQFERGPVESLVAATKRTGDVVLLTLNSLKKMLMGLISPKNLSGPITIAKVATTSAQSGLEAYIGFLALLSVSIGVLNLLPIPMLDGGHLMFYTVELLRGKPVPENVQVVGYQLGLFLVLGIMMFALYNDFTRL